jgi:hypothetical protein
MQQQLRTVLRLLKQGELLFGVEGRYIVMDIAEAQLGIPLVRKFHR